MNDNTGSNDNWEIGFNSGNLDDLLSGEGAAMTLWFLAGYLKGLTDGGDLHSSDRRMVLEPDGDGTWRLRSTASGKSESSAFIQ
jgi:hypothetical protein